jgi:PPE-repeat protein
LFDFGGLPPEINSGRMYSGPGSGPMLAAASAWDGIAAELGSAATGYASAITELTSSPWVGPASQSMLSAVMPYVSWLSALATQAEETGGQARAAAAAYENAFMMTVPPPEIEANRALLMTLIATNVFGQNTPAIAATEAQYLEMWAQDAAAMYGYATSSATATELASFVSPPNTTAPDAVPQQAAAVSQAVGLPAGGVAQTTAQQLLSAAAVPQALQQLAAAPAAAVQPNFIWNTIQDFFLYGLPTPTNNWAGLTPANYTAVIKQTLQGYFANGLGAFGSQIGQQLFNGLGTTAGGSGAWYPTPQFAALGVGGWHFHSGAGLTSSIASSSKVGALSVPASWVSGIAPGGVEQTGAKLVSAHLTASPGNAGPVNAVNAPGAGFPRGSRAGQRGGNMGVRYGFRYSVLARPPSAG